MATNRGERAGKKPRNLDDVATAPYPVGLSPWVDEDEDDEETIRIDTREMTMLAKVAMSLDSVVVMPGRGRCSGGN
jgi:hypothetical protein